MEAGAVREKLGPDKIPGSFGTNGRAGIACTGAWCRLSGVGAVFATGSKADAAELPMKH